jgi:hypothetical protein
MAEFNDAPNTWIASWSEDATTISFPIASLTGLTAEKADGTTGDIRSVLLSLLKTLATQWATMSSAEQPSYMKIYASASTNATTGEITRSYTIQLTTAVSGEDVKDEPA